MTVATATLRSAGQYIAAQQEFQGSHFRGTKTFDGMGELHRAYDAMAVSTADYVVYSYSTPIAWCIGGAWVIPCESYSVTTTKHQNIVRRATHR